jgi:uncharacterized protein YceK
MKIKSLITLLATAIAAVYLSGCAAVIIGGAAGAGTYAYIRGEMKGNENATLDRTWSATQAAMKDLEFSVVTQQKDALQGRLVARTALDKKIEINLIKISDNLTEVRIRVGTFGDQTLSHTIVQSIEKRL